MLLITAAPCSFIVINIIIIGISIINSTFVIYGSIAIITIITVVFTITIVVLIVTVAVPVLDSVLP